MATFIESILISDLEKGNFYHNFNYDNKYKTFNLIELDDDSSADMWSSFIEIMTCIPHSVPIPCLDHDWTIILRYQVWNKPIYLYDMPTDIIEVKIQCYQGEIKETAFKIDSGRYIEIDNEIIAAEGHTKLNRNVVDDIRELNFYRWNPRLHKETINCIENYFLKIHDEWCSRDKGAWEEEMNAVIDYIKMQQLPLNNSESDRFHLLEHEDYVSRVEARPYSRQDIGKKEFKYTCFRGYSDHGIDVAHTEDDFQNFFYSYAEFKKFKDFEPGMMCIYMLDSNTDLYMNVYKKMIPQDCDSQFFFIKYSKEFINELKRENLGCK